MQVDAFGHFLDIDVPETVRCAVCQDFAERLSSAWQGEGSAYHNYRCRADDCPAGGTIIEYETGERHRIGPVFGGHDLATRLAGRDQSDTPAERRKVQT
jgi:hypothetical protein